MNKIHKILCLGAVALSAASCTDTWSEHYDTTSGTAATQTIWELLSEDENTSKFAAIAETVHYYRDQTHPQADYTYQAMLDGTQLLTLWAPTNDALTAEEWAKWEELAESKPYTVQQQFLANSIALWRQVATGGGCDTLTMLNGKKYAFDKDNFTMAELPITDKNIPATNGTLHLMSSKLPFDFNIYEFLKDEDNSASYSLNTFHDLLIESDTTYFSESNSIEGTPDADGNPTYVDSVYYTTNTMFRSTKSLPSSSSEADKCLTYDESFGANIESEDSSFIMIMPTDAAWAKAYAMLEPYYNYASIYVDKEKGNNGTTSYRSMETPDSLKEKSINMDILSPLCYNLTFQPNAAGQIGTWKSVDDFMSNMTQAKYVINTFGDTLRTDDTWAKESIFNGTQVEMSNGLGIITDEWPIPAKVYTPDIISEVGRSSFYNYTNATGSITAYSFSNDAASAWVDSVGRVSNDNFYCFAPNTPDGNPVVDFKLIGTDGENKESEVMSGKYDIYVVMVPSFYTTSSDSIVGDTVHNKVKATISYCNNNSNGKDATLTCDTVNYVGDKVEELLLFEDFEFPYSYKNMRQCYPTLSLTTYTKYAERNKNGYSNTIYVDRIILRRKD